MTEPDLTQTSSTGARSARFGRDLARLRWSLSDQDIRRLLKLLCWAVLIRVIMWMSSVPLDDWPFIGSPIAGTEVSGPAHGIVATIVAIGAFLLLVKFFGGIDSWLEARRSYREALLAALESAEANQAQRHAETMEGLQRLRELLDQPARARAGGQETGTAST